MHVWKSWNHKRNRCLRLPSVTTGNRRQRKEPKRKAEAQCELTTDDTVPRVLSRYCQDIC